MSDASYMPVRTLSKGGMGSVDLAVRKDGEFLRLYALKRLLPHLREDEECRAMFVDEARIAGMIHHPNVVSAVDVGEDDQGPFLVMEYVEGIPLSTLIFDQDATELLPIQLAVRIGLQIAEGLKASHCLVAPDGEPMAVIHRDISPQNVLIGYDGVVRITDFGIAKAMRKSTHTRTGILKGKIGYMSPEQLRFEKLDRRSDLFSLGVILYELLSGMRLYDGKADDEIAKRILNEAPPDIEDERPDCPPALVELLFTLLAKDPELRPLDAESVARQLHDVLAELMSTEGVLLLEDYIREEFAERREREREELKTAIHTLEERRARRERAKRARFLAIAGSVLAVTGAGLGVVWPWGASGGDSTSFDRSPDTGPVSVSAESTRETPTGGGGENADDSRATRLAREEGNDPKKLEGRAQTAEPALATEGSESRAVADPTGQSTSPADAADEESASPADRAASRPRTTRASRAENRARRRRAAARRARPQKQPAKKPTQSDGAEDDSLPLWNWP